MTEQQIIRFLPEKLSMNVKVHFNLHKLLLKTNEVDSCNYSLPPLTPPKKKPSSYLGETVVTTHWLKNEVQVHVLSSEVTSPCINQ